ncbi:hypothetical protein LEP1GSC039_2298 [Leptospira santarosai str. 2000027870]|nr:hypothetical protein LEP1GSC039_2298 [Leptospira santarosai str. 2000027870]
MSLTFLRRFFLVFTMERQDPLYILFLRKNRLVTREYAQITSYCNGFQSKIRFHSRS